MPSWPVPVACDSPRHMSRHIALAYTLASLAAAVVPLLTMLLLTLPSSRGEVSMLVALLRGTWPWVTGFVVAIVLPSAVLLRRLMWFRPWPMGGAGFIAAAVLTGALMSGGNFVPMSWFGVLYASVVYGGAGAQCALVFWFVFRAIAGPERSMADAIVEA